MRRWLPLVLSLSLLGAPSIVVAQSLSELFQQGSAAQTEGRFSDAETIWDRLLERDLSDTDRAAAYNNLGIALRNQGRNEEAERAYRQALDLDPNYAFAYNNLGYLLMQVERYDEAIANLNRALAIDPNYTTAQNNLREAQRLLAIANAPTDACRSEATYIPTDEPLTPTLRSVVRIVSQTPGGIQEGSGWVLSRSGDTVLIATNRHVIAHDNDADNPNLSDNIRVDWFSEPPNGVYCDKPARVVQHSSDPDLAILEVRGVPDDIQPLNINFELPGRLAQVIAIGHPVTGAPWSVVRGDIANRNFENLQIDAPIAPGNSGGPVFDESDRVIGMMLAVAPSDDASGGFAFAYPLAHIRSQLEAWEVLP